MVSSSLTNRSAFSVFTSLSFLPLNEVPYKLSQRKLINITYFFNGSDLDMESFRSGPKDFPNNFEFRNRFSKIEGRIHNILEFSIELIKGLILHPYFIKTTSESLKLHSLYCLGTFISGLKNSPCVLSNFRG